MKEERPVLNLPKTQWENILDGLAITGLAIGLGLLSVHYPYLPPEIPTHFDIYGQPDDYSSKIMLLILMGTAVVMAAFMWYLVRIPHKFNYLHRVTQENAEATYYQGRLLIRILNTGIIWIFTYIIWRTIEIVNGFAQDLGFWFLPLVLITTIAVPIYIAARMTFQSK